MPLEDPRAPQAVWRPLYWILALAFLARAALALAGDFVLHPDEIMQYLEPAHQKVFGSGVMFWEFQYGGRSWLVPGLVASILWLCQQLGLGEPAVYIAAVKLAFCAISLAIPAGMYFAGRRLYGERTGRIALILGSFWYELVAFAHKPMTEFVATALLLGLLAWSLRPPAPRRAALAAGMAVLTVAVRFQYAVLAAVLLAWDFLRSDRRTRLAAIFGGGIALAAIGLFDYLTWGGFFQSYWLNLAFNLTQDRSADGSTAWHYLGWLALASGGAIAAAMISGFAHWRRHALLLALMLAVLLPHMPLDHREYRFLFAIIPLWLMVFSDLLAAGWKAWERDAEAPRRWRPALGLGLAAAISLLGIFNAIPQQRLVYAGYSGETGIVSFVRDQDPRFPIYRALARDPSVCGVLDATRAMINVPGYYYLHQQVPLYHKGPIDFIMAHGVHNFVTHIVTDRAATRGPIVRQPDGTAAMRIGGRILPLPTVAVDTRSKQLMHMDANGRTAAIDGFALARNIRGTTVWASKHRTASQTCRTYAWADYSPPAFSPEIHTLMESLLGERTPKLARTPELVKPH